MSGTRCGASPIRAGKRICQTKGLPVTDGQPSYCSARDELSLPFAALTLFLLSRGLFFLRCGLLSPLTLLALLCCSLLLGALLLLCFGTLLLLRLGSPLLLFGLSPLLALDIALHHRALLPLLLLDL